MLVPRVVTFNEACSTALVGEVCTVSHRWMEPHDPDADGTQLAAIKAHLDAHPNIKYVWYDAWCLPQGDRTADELVEFKRMLKEVNLLYLGSSVLVLLGARTTSRGPLQCHQTFRNSAPAVITFKKIKKITY